MSYRVGGRCDNCGHSQCYDIQKGKLKEDGLAEEKCSHCGVVGTVLFNPYQEC